MPPHRRPSDPPPPPRGIPSARRSSAGLSTLARPGEVAALLEPFVADEEDREFIGRCISTEGPAHHRAASVALLRLLAQALEAAGGAPEAGPGDGVPVPFRLPPHLDRHADADAHYPLRLPRRALERLAPPGSRDADAYAEALTDGPAHHALANVAMVCLVDALIERLSRGRGA